MSRRRILLFLPVAVILAVAGAFYLLMHTAPGARWLWERTAGLLPGQLQAATVEGSLQSGLRLRDVLYRDGALLVRADRLNLRLDLDVLPPSVAVHSLDFGMLEILSEPGEDDSPASVGGVLEAMALPLPVRFGAVRGDRFLWRAGAEDPGLEIRSPAFSAAWFKDLRVEDIHLTLPEPAMEWAGRVSLGLTEPFELDLEARGTVSAEGLAVPGESLDLEVRARGNLRELSLNAETQTVPARLSGRLLDLVERPSWDLQLAAEQLSWPPDADDAMLIGSISASSYGGLDDFGLEVEADFSERAPAGLAGLKGRLVGAGNLETLQVEVLEIASESVTLSGDGRLGLSHGFRVDGTVAVARADPAPWFEPWGDAAPFSGVLDLAWRDGRVEFAGRELRAPGTVASLAGNGTFDAADQTVDARLDWRELAWPPGAQAPEIVSPGGSVRIAGRLERWSVDGELELEGADFPRGRAEIRGTGDAESLALEIPRGEILGGSLAGQFALRWAPETTWSARARFEELLTAPLAPSWPGRISGEASLQAQADPLTLDVDIADLGGTLRDRPVAARGGLRYAGGSLFARNLEVRFGASDLTIDGDMGGRTGLNFSARIDSLGDLADGAAGSVAGEGRVSLDPANPSIVLNLEGQGLAWGDYSADALRVTTSADGDGKVRVEGERLGIGETELESLVLVTDSRRPLDVVEAEADLGHSQLALTMSGRVGDWSAPVAGGWQGLLRQFRWGAGSEEWVELEEPVELALNREAATLGTGCLRGSWRGRMCLEGDWRPQGESGFDAFLENVSPNLALRLADSDLVFSQVLSGTVTWRQSAAARPRAAVDLTLSPGDVRIEGEDEAIITTGRGRFGFEIAEGRLFAGNLDIPMPGSGGIDTDFGAPDLADGLESPIQGRLQVNLKDIGPFLELIPAIEGSSGPVAADLRFSGTAGDPRFTGHVSLVRGRLSHFASGLQIEDLKLAGAVYEFDQTELLGTFRAGEGQGSIRAVVNFGDLLAPEILVQLDGQGLTLVDVPDLNLKADPDIRLTWRDDTLGIDGRVRVPSARLSPRYLPTSSASESPDVVIVAGEDPMARPEDTGTADLRIQGELELELGKDVRLQLERATARLRGTAIFTWKDELMPTAAGGFELDGEIYAYGQLLSVTEGQVNFAERPADNPFLTVRAEREIFGNSQVRRAGVLVTGTLKRPVLETYTDPMTTRERALTLLVTGNDFNYEQGVGAVEVGMYVAPKLFISYGIGLFDDQSVISARYDLGKGFGVKATSGQRETGVDISYTIER